MPWIKNGQLGNSVPIESYDLKNDPYEKNEDPNKWSPFTLALSEELLKIHNQGHSRKLEMKRGDSLILEPGWHNLRNDLIGEVGFQFSVTDPKTVTHLGMWVAPDRAPPARPARSIGTEFDRDQPSPKRKRSLTSDHTVRLLNSKGTEVVKVTITAGKEAKKEEFLYVPLTTPINLKPDSTYLLLQSTRAFDGDSFRDPVSYDGLSPLVHPEIEILRSVLVKSGDQSSLHQIPAFADMHESFNKYRLPAGPTLKFSN